MRRRRLRGRHEDHLSDVGVRWTCGTEDHRLRNILAPQGLQALVNPVRALRIAVEPHQCELRLDHPGVDGGNPDPRAEGVDPEGAAEGRHRVLCGAVDIAARVDLVAGDNSFSRSFRRAASSNRQLFAAKASAQALPMPLEAPVISTHRLVRSTIIQPTSHDQDSAPFHSCPTAADEGGSSLPVRPIIWKAGPSDRPSGHPHNRCVGRLQPL